MENIQEKLKNIDNTITTSSSIERSLSEWRQVLARECQVYVYNESYLAKRFDQIRYAFVTQKKAQEILKDNLYALLRFKYFPKLNDEVEEHISEIVTSFMLNIKTSLIRVSFNEDDECKLISFLPDGCIAFRNGVFNFKTNDWLFKYDKIRLETLQNTVYSYDPKYIITWYVNLDFEPLPFDINDFTLEEFIDVIKDLDKQKKNYCFELMYNMSHNIDNEFDYKQFIHLCQILGYTCMQSFVQAFVMLIGSGQNGKNSLFDGCFSSRVVPSPVNVDLDSLEDDKFITGALENNYHNFFLETDPKTRTKSAKLKQITGSMYQTIEHKGEDRYAGVINCKNMWSANDQDNIKFADTTTGFRRRINLFEVWYHWDEKKDFLKRGKYFDTTFSEDLHEIKEDVDNYIYYIYFAMYGIKLATNDFTHSFKFTENDWKLKYTDIDFDLKSQIENISLGNIYMWIKKSTSNYEEGKSVFYDMKRKRLFESHTVTELGYNNYPEFVEKLINDPDASSAYFTDNYCYISVRFIQALIGGINSSDATKFTQSVKKIYNIQSTVSLNSNKPYVKCTFVKGKLRIMSE